jgi:hypothetical protein
MEASRRKRLTNKAGGTEQTIRPASHKFEKLQAMSFAIRRALTSDEFRQWSRRRVSPCSMLFASHWHIDSGVRSLGFAAVIRVWRI